MIHGVGLIGGAIEVGAADACAVKDVVQPMVLPDWALNSMLDVVERYRLTLNGEVGFVPRAEGKEWPHGENAFFLGVVEYDLNGHALDDRINRGMLRLAPASSSVRWVNTRLMRSSLSLTNRESNDCQI